VKAKSARHRGCRLGFRPSGAHLAKDPSDFWACCEISVGRLTEKLAQLTGAKGKVLERKFNDAFGELVSFRRYAPELERYPGTKHSTLDHDEPNRLERLAPDTGS
jgi:hypothetical protein